MTDIKEMLQTMVKECPACYGHGYIIVCCSYSTKENYKDWSGIFTKIIKAVNYHGKKGEPRWCFYHAGEGIYCLNGRVVYHAPGLQECFHCGKLRKYLNIEQEEVPEDIKEANEEQLMFWQEISHAA
jgi:hypothetical protein